MRLQTQDKSRVGVSGIDLRASSSTPTRPLPGPAMQQQQQHQQHQQQLAYLRQRQQQIHMQQQFQMAVQQQYSLAAAQAQAAALSGGHPLQPHSQRLASLSSGPILGSRIGPMAPIHSNGSLNGMPSAVPGYSPLTFLAPGPMGVSLPYPAHHQMAPVFIGAWSLPRFMKSKINCTCAGAAPEHDVNIVELCAKHQFLHSLL